MEIRAWKLGILALGVCLVVANVWWWYGSGTPTTLLLVRHADRAGSADELAAPGRERARDLARALEKAGVAAIYHSDTARTRDTALPLARTLGLTPFVRPGAAVRELVDEIFERHPGQTVLVVGHSNTVPELIREAGGPALPDLPEDEFDDLFALIPRSGGFSRASLVQLQYGAASP